MLNIFINSSIYGQSIGSTFNFSQAVIGKPLSSRRLTPNAYANIIAPIYERQIDMEKITMLYKSRQIDKVNKLNRGVYSENIRVNSLYILIRELQLIDKLAVEHPQLEKEMIIAYVPPQLLRELQSGRYKFYINGISESTYYSEQELTMWIDANEIIAKLYSRLVFTNIENCKANNTGTAIQQERVGLYNAMINRIKEAYKALKQQREIAAKSASVNKEPINTDDIFNSIDWSAFGNVTETTQNKEVEINKAV